jgi:long-chain fatty acid transport protein
MIRSLRLLAALLLAAAAVPALATNGMRMTGFGAVQNSMGGVGVAANLDGSAIVSNPAGLSDLARRLDLGVTWFKPTVEYTATGIAPPFVNQAGVTFKSDRGGSPIPTVAVVIPLGGGFTAGVGAFGTAGMGVDYKANLYYGKTLTSYQNLRLAPALAWKPNEMFSAGVAVNAMWAQMKYDVASGFGQVPHDAANAFGFGATVGVKFTPVKDLSIGAAYETKSWFGNFEFTIPAHAVPDGAGGTVNVPGGTDQLDFDQPAVLSGGVAYRVMPSLLVAADVQWINWSDTNGKNKPAFKNDTNMTGALPFNMSWKDQVVYKIGLAFDATSLLAIRAGYDYGKNPLDTTRAFENIAFPAIAEHHISLGLGLNATETLAINVGGTYSPKSTISGANASPPPGGQGIASYKTSMSQYAIDLGVGWKF